MCNTSHWNNNAERIYLQARSLASKLQMQVDFTTEIPVVIFWCSCPFCSVDGCNHGKSPLSGGVCSLFTCTQCIHRSCYTVEWQNIGTIWKRPIQQKREGGGTYWTNEQYLGTRKKMVKSIRREMRHLKKHDDHVIFHKRQLQKLLEHRPPRSLVIKCDFIQNIAHSRGCETSQAFFNKRQTQFLSFVVWYDVEVDGVFVQQKQYFDFLSSYLKHNFLFFQKCVLKLLHHLRVNLNVDFNKVLSFFQLSPQV